MPKSFVSTFTACENKAIEVLDDNLSSCHAQSPSMREPSRDRWANIRNSHSLRQIPLSADLRM
jgi:hypothetical protein